MIDVALDRLTLWIFSLAYSISISKNFDIEISSCYSAGMKVLPMKLIAPCFSDVSALNKAAGDPLRLEVLRVLAQDSYGVLELCEIFEHKQSGMSHHLKVLAGAGLVAKRREGNSIFYSRALPSSTSGLALLQQQLYTTIDSIDVRAEITQRLQEIQRERVKASQQFFILQADKFKAQQDLIAEYPAYGDAVAELLHKMTVLPSSKKGQVTANGVAAIEIGPGAGEFLPELAKRFDRVLAVDNAPTMLERSQAYCQQQGIENVEFVSGDTSDLAGCKVKAACVVMNMVLHHTPSPADIFIDIARSLEDGGVLIVTDLCRHDQDWAKTACGDVWLGFDAEELQRWALLAGLQQGHSKYLALRNGFQIQVQQFKKM
ncbi:MAG: DNA-binding transcriptional ArsR family regulator/SAM-dependent methyltransferase [Kiritimatiellia bacterium]